MYIYMWYKGRHDVKIGAEQVDGNVKSFAPKPYLPELKAQPIKSLGSVGSEALFGKFADPT